MLHCTLHCNGMLHCALAGTEERQRTFDAQFERSKHVMNELVGPAAAASRRRSDSSMRLLGAGVRIQGA